MTTEQRIVAGLKDIKTLGYECHHCGAKVTFPVGAEIIPRQDCHSCHKPWQPQPVPTSWVSGGESSAFMSLIKAINAIRTLEKQNALGFKFIMEFEEASSGRARDDRA